MSLQIIAPCFYHSSESLQLKYFNMSAVKHKIDVIKYGQNEPYKGWVDAQITRCLVVLKSLYCSHVLATDAGDVIFTQGADEIMRRYMCLGKPPMLMGYEVGGVNAGGWIGEREVAIAMLEQLAKDGGSGDPQVRWRNAIERRAIRVYVDEERRIFDVNPPDVSKSDACIVHLAGGFSHQETGKEERLAQAWKELGYE